MTQLALDCGAGIGRVTKSLLSKRFDKIDLVEPAANLIEMAKKNLRHVNQVRNFYKQGIQDYKFVTRYDCIWVQWCLCFLTRPDLLKFLNLARKNLRKLKLGNEWKTGYLFIKENTDDENYIIEDQNQYIRTLEEYEQFYHQTGFSIVHREIQKFKNNDLCKVTMWVL